MSDFLYLIPLSIVLGAAGLAVFLWSLRAGQYEDLDGAATRVVIAEDVPLPDDEGPQRHRSSPGRGGAERSEAEGSRFDR